MVDVDLTGKTTFRLRIGGASSVHVVGDFCHWQPDHLPMRQVGTNDWMLMMRLPPGTYEFRYHVDGQWVTDFAGFGVALNPYREYNGVVRVPKVQPVLEDAAKVRLSSLRRTRRLARSA